MILAEFAEKTYENPLYTQLERKNPFVYCPSQVLEKTVGFDAGLWTSNMILWQVLGYPYPLAGTVLGDLPWAHLGPKAPKSFPDVALNLFVQAKRPSYSETPPASLAEQSAAQTPLWSFKLTQHQQKMLEALANETAKLAHVSYAAPVFHTNTALYNHMKAGTLVETSTFPSVKALSGHDAWYYWSPGATGMANPDPVSIEEAGLVQRLRNAVRAADRFERGDLRWLDLTADALFRTAVAAEGSLEAVAAHFINDSLEIDRLAELAELRPSLAAYARIGLFAARFDLQWLVVTHG